MGRRFKSSAYKRYTRDLTLLLPSNYPIPPKPYEIHFKWGFSTELADWDNPIKPAQDIICKKYGIDDRYIKQGIVSYEKVKKGEEFIQFEILHYEEESKD